MSTTGHDSPLVVARRKTDYLLRRLVFRYLKVSSSRSSPATAKKNNSLIGPTSRFPLRVFAPLDAFGKEKNPAVIVGGVASLFLGCNRLTKDLDIASLRHPSLEMTIDPATGIAIYARIYIEGKTLPEVLKVLYTQQAFNRAIEEMKTDQEGRAIIFKS
ncbi:hypothetical protein E4T56_gene343 [Termitomyces sp. T112]|nr:hypothetical protein E4T56_gene343 [Termitomyces sp. T112]